MEDHKIEIVQLPTSLDIDKFRRILPESMSRIWEVLTRSSTPVYVVGGAVRDYFLGRPIVDTDLVVEGDALGLASAVGKSHGWKVHLEPRFLTARLEATAGNIEFVTARTERYPAPGALPVVRPASLTEDLSRRDFSINAIAVALRPPHELVGPANALSDLSRRQLRVLHPRSFIDDPTRVLRLARYAALLGFVAHPATRRRALAAHELLESISPARRNNEIDKAIRSDSTYGVLRAMGRLELSAPLGWRRPDWQILKNGFASEWFVRSNSRARLRLGWAALSLGWAGDAVPRHGRKLASTVESLIGGLSNSTVLEIADADHISGYSIDEMEIAATLAPAASARRILRRALHNLRQAGQSATGDQIRRWLDIPPGPQVGKALQALQTARIAGEIRSEVQQERWVREWATMRS